MYILCLTLLMIAWSQTEDVLGAFNQYLPYMWWGHIAALVAGFISVLIWFILGIVDNKSQEKAAKTIGQCFTYFILTSPLFLTAITVAENSMADGVILNYERFGLAAALYLGGILMQIQNRISQNE